MTIVMTNYNYVNWIHEARFTWKRIPQDALWDDGNCIPSLLVWTNPCSILTFMEYNPNVILLTACSHYVINYLHKFSCPPENSFWPGSPESKQGVPLWVSAPFHARCQLAVLTVRRMRQALLSHHGTCMVVCIQCMHVWLHGGDGTREWRAGRRRFIFWNDMIWQRVDSLFCFRESPVRGSSCFNSCRAYIAYHIRSWL